MLWGQNLKCGALWAAVAIRLKHARSTVLTPVKLSALQAELAVVAVFVATGCLELFALQLPSRFAMLAL